MADVFSLTGFQRDLLYVLSSGRKLSGREIKRELERERGEVTRGQLYPNLDTLVEKGLIKKGQKDRRTNFYRISSEGREQLERRRQWENRYFKERPGNESK